LDDLFEKRYTDILGKSEKQHRADKQKFKMKAKQVQEMQEIVQDALGSELPYSEYMKMFKPDLADFVKEFNQVVIKEFDMTKIIEYVSKKGEFDINLSGVQERRRKASTLKVPLGYFMAPVFNTIGEMVGF